MKKWLALFLTLALTLSMIPNVFALHGSHEAERDVWDVISAIEDRADAEANAANAEDRIAAYNAKIEEIIDAVTSSSTYVPGTLERHGNFFFWVDTDGNPNGYSPSLRARQRAGAIPGADPMDYAATEVVSYTSKGGFPGSVDVAAFQPYIGIDGSFTNQYEVRCNAIAQSTGGTGTTYKTNNANINNIGLALSTCGVVIFDSHGTTDYEGWNDYTSQANSSYLCLTTGTGITSADKASATGDYGTYYHAFQSGSTWCIDGTAMTNHMTTDSPDGILWMAICLGMATDGLQAPIRSRGMEVVYGYSQSVTFSGDYKYEGFFWPYMCEDHTVAESAAYMKTKANCDWDPAYSSYSYSQAVANHVAFPIFVSSEDVYPGHGNVDVIQPVYSTYTLYTQYNITAVSNNDEWGTVSVAGRTITATPATGYEIVGYQVLSGTAEVTRDGNKFQVQAETDCTIQINFAARVPATVNFSVPEGVSCDTFTGYVGDTLVMPTPTGTPAGNAHNYAFLGWTLTEIEEDVTEFPVFQKAGTELTVSVPETTYYALYSYFVAEDGFTEGEFTLVSSAPTNWAGEYVLTYQGQKILGASGNYSTVNISTDVYDLSEIGGVLSGNILSNIPDEYIYTIEESNGGTYALKMKEQDTWLALTSDSNSLMTADDNNENTSCWNLSCNSEGVQIASAVYPNRTIRFNNRASAFRCYKSGQQQISLYAAAQGTKWYTTSPKYRVECEVHSFGDWSTVLAPTCTDPGLQKRVCTVCGYTETEELDALGHDYSAGEPVAPTCTEQGYTVYTCSRCGDNYMDDYTDALGHDYTDVITEPNCTEQGYTTHTCSRCGDVMVDTYTDALGHDYTDEITEPNCTEQGYTTHTCSRCGDVMVDTYTDALGHDYTDVITEPSCTEQGYTTHTCTRCGDSYVDSYVEAAGHSYGDPVWQWNEDLTAATASFTCACGDTQVLEAVVTEEIETEPLPHIPGEKWIYATVSFENWSYTDEKTVEIPALPCPCEMFVDMPPYGTIEHAAIDWAFTQEPKITEGMDTTHFGPEETVTRAQAMRFLWNAAEQPEPASYENPFVDVKPDKWYTTPVLWAYNNENRITSGMDDTHFGVNTGCTRGHIITFLWNALGCPAPTIDNPYTDVTKPDGSNRFYTEAAIWAYEVGIEKGEDGKFSPNIDCTRKAIVTYLYRYYTGEGLME
jgi:hypothetical protein